MKATVIERLTNKHSVNRMKQDRTIKMLVLSKIHIPSTFLLLQYSSSQFDTHHFNFIFVFSCMYQ